jgi:hypothetical protein
MRPRILCASIATALAVGGAARADTTLNFFGDLGYVVEHDDGVTNNTFQAANFDVFATQTEGKFSFIGEMIIEAFGSNEFAMDLDRLEVSYKARPWLHFRAGRMRTAFGYYGDAYQNGKFFMTTVSWPELYEGDGFDGILPTHSIGAHVDASYGLGTDSGKLTADFEILNGRGTDVGEVSAFQDANNSKAINLRLRYVGGGSLEGLVVGGNVYVDDIPADLEAADVHPAMHEVILGAHAAYVADRVHLIGEAAWFRHREHGTDTIHETISAFGEAGYAFGEYTPYTRFEYTHSSDVDPYFASSGLPTDDLELLSAGVKYTASASVAFKLEVAADLGDSHRHALAQAAFAF